MDKATTMRFRWPARLAMVLLACAPGFVSGGEPATQPTLPASGKTAAPAGENGPATKPFNPADDRSPRKTDHFAGADDTLGGRGRLGQRGLQLSPDETEEAMRFMRVHSPRRYSALESLREGPQKAHIKNLAAVRYMQLIRLEKSDPELFKKSLARTELEDEIFGLAAELRKAPADKQEALKTQLHDKVTTLVNAEIDERQARLKTLEKAVEKARLELVSEQNNREATVDNQVYQLMHDERGLGASIPGNGNGNAQHRNRQSPEPTPAPQ